jgi:hypothetical protein
MARRGLIALGTATVAVIGLVAPTGEATARPRRPPSIVLVGDSVMSEIAVAATAATKGTARVDWVLTPGVVLAKPDFWTQWPDIFSRDHPTAVAVLVGPWEVNQSTFGTASWRRWYRGQLDRWAALLRTSDAPITWMSALPARDASYTARLTLVNREYAALARRQPGITTFASAAPLGSGSYREFTPAGTRLRRVDGLHLCPEATALVTAALLRSLGVPTVPGWEHGAWRTDPAVYRADQCP